MRSHSMNGLAARVLPAALALALLLTAAPAAATPSTTWWTPATTYVQPYLVPHLTYDTYFGEAGALPIDTGVTVGILPFERLQAEVGFDLFYPGLRGKEALQLNAKIGVPEGAFGPLFPGISAGVYGVGFKKGLTDLDVFHLEIGKTLGAFGTLVAGGYAGNGKLLVDETGAKANTGLLAAYVSPDLALGLPGLGKLNLFADLQSGKSSAAAWGFGAGLYFTPAVALLTGPVFFLNDKLVDAGAIPARMLWSVQLDVDVELLAKPKT